MLSNTFVSHKSLNSMSLSKCFWFFVIIGLVLSSCYDGAGVGVCEGIYCDNGGDCVNGACDCPDGYVGPACEDQDMPTYMKITRVDVLEFPAWDSSGGSWDINGTGADITIKISYQNGGSIYSSDVYFENAISNSSHTFNDINAIVNQAYEGICISLYNYDTIFGGESFMGGVCGPIHSLSSGFPASVNYSYGGYSYMVYLEYFF